MLSGLVLLFSVLIYQSLSSGTPDADCSSYTKYSDYSDVDIKLKGSSLYNGSTSEGWSSCDMAFSNNTWYRFTGALQQVKVTQGECIKTYFCNTKDTWALDGTDKKNDEKGRPGYYQLGILLYVSEYCIDSTYMGYANIYECDTFLLYNFPVIDPAEQGIFPNCKDPDNPKFEPAGICLEDTVESLTLTSGQTYRSYQLPIRLTANATRSPASPEIIWIGDNTTVLDADRVGYIGDPLTMWSEIMVPGDAVYRTVQYCVNDVDGGNRTCETFELYSLEVTGSFQKRKVLFLEATIKSTIEATDITWEVNSKTYSTSGPDVVIDDGSLDDSVQKASITLYNVDFDYVANSAEVTLTVDDSNATETASNVASIDDCPNDKYFSKGVCVSCPANMTSPVGSVTMDACQCNENTYRSADTCINCPANSTSPAGSLTSDACVCNANTYADAGACTNCPQGYHSKQGSKNKSDCKQDVCPVNTYFKDGICEPCPSGTHSKEGSTSISQCKKKSFPLEMVLIVIATCLVLIIVLVIAVLIYKKRKEDAMTKAAVKYAVNNATVT